MKRQNRIANLLVLCGVIACITFFVGCEDEENEGDSTTPATTEATQTASPEEVPVASSEEVPVASSEEVPVALHPLSMQIDGIDSIVVKGSLLDQGVVIGPPPVNPPIPIGDPVDPPADSRPSTTYTGQEMNDIIDRILASQVYEPPEGIDWQDAGYTMLFYKADNLVLTLSLTSDGKRFVFENVPYWNPDGII